MEIIVKSLILSVMLGISCKEYFGIFLQERWKLRWLNYSINLVFTAGFMVISFSPIPPYLWQPVRLIVMIWSAAQICFKVKPYINILLTLFLSGLIWVLASMTNGILGLLQASPGFITHMGDTIWCSVLLCMMLLFAYYCKGKLNINSGARCLYFAVFPILSISVSVVLSVIIFNGWEAGEGMAGMVIAGTGIINILAFYLIAEVLLKEARVQEVKLQYEQSRNQMKLYQAMEQNYQSQKGLMHDYKNQLSTIQGLLVKNQAEEALSYVEKLAGKIKKISDYVDTNHAVVNVVLNQKYQDALSKGITIVMAVNDLSGLTISEEEIVTLLVNLLDNAMEACEKTKDCRIIRFKMLIEEGMLLLSVGNQVKEPVAVKEKRVLSTKKDAGNHGTGLLNVDSVIKKNGGTSVIQCSDGWFWFSAMLPL